MDVSGLEYYAHSEELSEIKMLKNDYGLTAGCNITNSFQDEIDAGLSTRIYGKINLLSSGFYSNQKQAEILDLQMELDSLSGNKRIHSNNYGIAYDYIINEFNKQKILLHNEVMRKSERLIKLKRDLYHQKQIEFKEVIASEKILFQTKHLIESYAQYNDLFSQTFDTKTLPNINRDIIWKVDFDKMIDHLDTTQFFENQIQLHNTIQDLQYQELNAPSLSLTTGYDISRKRPYFSVNFNAKLSRHKKKNRDAKKEKTRILLQSERGQIIKEVLNYQYEYDYKRKQILSLLYDLKDIEERSRSEKAKSNILGLNESIIHRQLQIEKDLVNLEIIDLKQQLSILLLQIKKTIHPILIMDYITPERIEFNNSKFSGNRILMVDSGIEFTIEDKEYIAQNELTILNMEKIIQLENVTRVEPSEYESREVMETVLQEIHEEIPEVVFLFEGIKDLRALDIKTIQLHASAMNVINN